MQYTIKFTMQPPTLFYLNCFLPQQIIQLVTTTKVVLKYKTILCYNNGYIHPIILFLRLHPPNQHQSSHTFHIIFSPLSIYISSHSIILPLQPLSLCHHNFFLPQEQTHSVRTKH